MSRPQSVPSLKKSSTPRAPGSWETLASVLEGGSRDEAWHLALAEVLAHFSPYQGEVVPRMAAALEQAAPHAPRKVLSDLVMLLARLCWVKDAVRPALDAMAIMILRDDVSRAALEALAFTVSISISTLDAWVARSNRASFARLLEALDERKQVGVADHLRRWGSVASLPGNAAQRFTVLSERAWPTEHRVALPSAELALIDQSSLWTDAASGELVRVTTKAATAQLRCDRKVALIDFGVEPARFMKPRRLTFTGALVAGDATAFEVIRSSEALIEQFTTGSWRGGALVANAKHSPLRLPRGVPPMVCVFEGQLVATAVIGTTARGAAACVMLSA